MHHQAEDLMLQLNSVGLSREKRDHQIVTDVTMLRNIAVLCASPARGNDPKSHKDILTRPYICNYAFTLAA